MTGLFQLMLLVSVTLASEPTCPACSKYDYEEKLLERMIRMEFAFEKVLKENKAVSKTVEQDLTRIKEENERLHATVHALKRNQSSTLEKIVSDSNTTLEQTIAAFNDIQDQIATQLVYFHAHFPQTSSLSTGEVIVYKTMETNQGSGYSATTGKFTAPVRGLYLFTMHSCTPTSAYAYLLMVKEGSSLHYDKAYHTCSSSQVFVLLDVGESVWVKCSTGGSGRQLYEDANHWTSFGGALIRN